ncbi:MAG: methionyl-tRNA formyltransferase [Candidatus Dojkabacteria bacterium]|nr:methionyl-tRNA formyltransferase [Candidatus Dojkabacteria bacterium]
MSVRLLFVGSGDFAVPILNKILSNTNFNIVGVVTQPDKLGGRGGKSILYTPVKQFLINNLLLSHIPLFQPFRIKDSYKEILSATIPDLIIVASYGQILPEDFIYYPKLKSLNFHASLLPKLRGATPIQMAIYHGFTETGVTLQLVDKKMDAGDIIAQRKVSIEKNDNFITLSRKLSFLASNMIDEELVKYINNQVVPIKQIDEDATYCYKSDVSREKSQIFFDTDIFLAERMIRAFYLDPGAWILYENKSIKIMQAEIFQIFDHNPMTFNSITLLKDIDHLLLYLSNGILKIIEMQVEGKTIRKSKDYFYLTSIRYSDVFKVT